MKTKAVFYHAGCPVCVAAEQNVAAALDPAEAGLMQAVAGQFGAALARGETAEMERTSELMRERSGAKVK